MPAREQLEIRETLDGARHTLALVGELDIASTPAMQTALTRVLANETRALRLDLRQLSFIDSTGLHAVLTAKEQCEARGYDFSLIAGPAPVQRLFELTNLLGVLPFVDPED